MHMLLVYYNENKKQKTRNRKQTISRKQKTKETMKTIMNQLAVAALFTFLLLGTTASAKGTETNVSSLENIKETTMQLESWMLNENFWNRKSVVEFEIIPEESLELEDWMLKEENWKNKPVNPETEVETALEFESWMVNEKIWKR